MRRQTTGIFSGPVFWLTGSHLYFSETIARVRFSLVRFAPEGGKIAGHGGASKQATFALEISRQPNRRSSLSAAL
jgi:hypothetical protein